jgi:dynein heavy chain 1
MKKVTKNPSVLEVLSIPNIQKTLERLADLLNKVQKALGEYLERERAAFPRFYFVGDEDLLEIIGNSKTVDRLQKHFRKMFAGVHTIILNEDGSEVLGLASREGEQVIFKQPVICRDVKINLWLTDLEKAMRITLAQLLFESVTFIDEMRQNGFNVEQYLKWIDQYQAQIVTLGSQLAWSQNVEAALTTMEGGSGDAPLKAVLQNVETTLASLADQVLFHQPPIRRCKLEHLITELVHQRDVTRHV